jgi:hypothetical protein
MMKPDDSTDLDVTIEHDKATNCILLSFAENDKTIIIGFSISEAQTLHKQLMEAIQEAMTAEMTPVPPTSETRH